MMYFIKRDIYNFLNKRIVSLVFLLTCIMVSKYYIGKLDTSMFLDVLFVNTNMVTNFIYVLYRLIYIGYLLYVCYYVYTYDIVRNPEFVFLRGSKNKIVNSKYISLLIINTFVYLIVFVIYIIFIHSVTLNVVKSIIYSFIFHFLIETIFICLISYIGKYSIFITFAIYYLISILFCNKYFLAEILIGIILILMVYVVNKLRILKLVEKER